MKNKAMFLVILMVALMFSYGMVLWEIVQVIPQNITIAESFSYLIIILMVTVFMFISLTGIHIIMAGKILDNQATILDNQTKIMEHLANKK